MVFYLPLYVVFRIFELADTSALTTYQFGDLLTGKYKRSSNNAMSMICGPYILIFPNTENENALLQGV